MCYPPTVDRWQFAPLPLWRLQSPQHWMAYLKHDASGKAFLEKTPTENGVNQHFMGITFRSRRECISSGRRVTLNGDGSMIASA
jgi:hypothetical protein